MPKTKYTYNPERKEWYTLVYDGTLTPSGAKHRKRITSKKSSRDLENKVAAFKAELQNKAGERIAAEAGEHFHYSRAEHSQFTAAGFVASDKYTGAYQEATDKVLTKAVHK